MTNQEDELFESGKPATVAFDLDGTLVSYGSDGGEPRFNYTLVGSLIAEQIISVWDSVAIVSNQAGVTLGIRGKANAVDRLLLAKNSLWTFFRITVSEIHLSMYHPKATQDEIQSASREIMNMGNDRGLTICAWSIEDMRKPNPGMIALSEVETYIGDSDEDEQAAAAANVRFIQAHRFMGGGG